MRRGAVTGAVAQVVRALDMRSEGRRSESYWHHFFAEIRNWVGKSSWPVLKCHKMLSNNTRKGKFAGTSNSHALSEKKLLHSLLPFCKILIFYFLFFAKPYCRKAKSGWLDDSMICTQLCWFSKECFVEGSFAPWLKTSSTKLSSDFQSCRFIVPKGVNVYELFSIHIFLSR